MASLLNDLFSNTDQGYLAVWNKRTRATHWFHVTELGEAENCMFEAAKADDVYFGWGLQASPLASGRGKSEAVCGLPGLMMDIDVRSAEAGVHAKNDHLPSTWEEALEFVRELGVPEPTAIRHSGNGVYFDWVFDRCAVIGSDKEREELANLSRRLQLVIKQLAEQRNGWKFDSTHDLTRITRLPGTFNHKTNPPKPVRLLSFDPERRYTQDELEAAVAALEAKYGIGRPQVAKKPALSHKLKAANDNSEPRSERDSFDAVVAGCAWADWTVQNAAKLPEPDWYASASIIGRCADGRELFHQLSKSDPRYDAQETDAKLTHALEDAGPRTCANIATELGFSGCLNCPFSGRVTTPLQLGRVGKVVVELMRSHVFDIASGRYIELETGRGLSDRAFSNKFLHLTKEKSPHSALMREHLMRKVDATDYLPGEDRLFVEEEGRDLLNLWRPGGVGPVAGDASIILEHFAYMFPDEAELKHVLDCFAHAVQKPREKIKHVLLMIGRQGIGKSFIGGLLTSIFGAENVWTVESIDLVDGWTAKMGNRQSLILEELSLSERREFYESLKRWITEERVTVNEKHIPKYEARTPRIVLAFSNHHVPTNLQDGDRRWWVSRSSAEPKDPTYYKRLFTQGMEQVPAFVDLLLKRDVGAFNASAPPPMTAAKQDILKASRPPLEREIEAMMEEGVDPFTADLFHTEAVRWALSTRLSGRLPSISEITRALKALGAEQLPQVRVGGNTRVRPWAWRNVERWADAQPGDVRQALGVKAA